MKLGAYVAEKQRKIHEELLAGHPPSEGDFDQAAFREAKIKGQPLIGAARFSPDTIALEFVFPDPKSAALVFTVTLSPPERIVFMPVPSWVIENVWQGSVDGSHRFESEAQAMLEQFSDELAANRNAGLFDKMSPMRRD